MDHILLPACDAAIPLLPPSWQQGLTRLHCITIILVSPPSCVVSHNLLLVLSCRLFAGTPALVSIFSYYLALPQLLHHQLLTATWAGGQWASSNNI